jgi:hypothetical protein
MSSTVELDASALGIEADDVGDTAGELEGDGPAMAPRMTITHACSSRLSLEVSLPKKKKRRSNLRLPFRTMKPSCESLRKKID